MNDEPPIIVIMFACFGISILCWIVFIGISIVQLMAGR